MNKIRVQLIGPIQHFPKWEENFKNMEKIITKVFAQQNKEAQIVNPAIFSSPKIKEPLLQKFKEFEKEAIRLLDLPIVYEPNEPLECFWFALSLLTIPTCDYVFISKLAVSYSVGSAIETLWASRSQVKPLFEVHITPEELERALKNAAFMAEMNEEDVYLLIEAQSMTLTFANQKDYEEKKKIPNFKFFEIMKIEHKKEQEEIKTMLKERIKSYKNDGFLAFFSNDSTTNIGFILTFYTPEELQSPIV